MSVQLNIGDTSYTSNVLGLDLDLVMYPQHWALNNAGIAMDRCPLTRLGRTLDSMLASLLATSDYCSQVIHLLCVAKQIQQSN